MTPEQQAVMTAAFSNELEKIAATKTASWGSFLSEMGGTVGKFMQQGGMAIGKAGKSLSGEMPELSNMIRRSGVGVDKAGKWVSKNPGKAAAGAAAATSATAAGSAMANGGQGGQG